MKPNTHPYKPVFAPAGGPPGAPIQWGEEVTNNTITPGFSYLGSGSDPEVLQYFYHSDHLGSTSYITNTNGDITQFIAYMPFGEQLAEQHADWDSPYKFNAKELDGETGLYYYGARYYDAKVSLWLGVDPMAEKFYYQSPYIYCSNNPINSIDINGMEDIIVVGNQGDGSKDETPNSDADGKYGKNTRHFLEAAFNYALGLKNDKEETTILVYKGEYTDDELNNYQLKAKENGINFKIVNDDADIADYINKKSTFAFSTSNRDKDKITDFAYFGHGDPDKMYIGYNTKWDGLERLSASSFRKNAFDENANIYLASCRSGLGELFETLKSYTNGVVKGYNVRVHWGEMVVGKKTKQGLGVYMAHTRHPDNDKIIVPLEKRIRIENGKR